MSAGNCAICGERLDIGAKLPDMERLIRLLDPDDEVTIDGVQGGAHRVCLFRMAVGSVAHIEGRCSCKVPGASEGDPEGMTKLEAAEAALAAFRKVRTWKM